MKKIIGSLIFFFIVFGRTALADSPVTSTIIYTFYQEYDIVNYALETGMMDDKIAAYLADEENLIDVKAAIINALGWDYYGKSNAEAFLNYIAKVRNTSADKVVFTDLTGAELMCYGYAKAMDDYSNVSESLQILELAKEKMPESYTVNLIHAVINGQYEFDANWCGIWQVTQRVLNNKSLRRDMKTAAIQSVVDYMILYKSYCA